MADRLSPLDVSFLYLEERSAPMHVGGVSIFEAPQDGFDYDRLVELIRDRIAFVPRYRQRLRWIPGGIANPVWIDDENFDVGYHVRRSALPRPGTDAQLRELVGRIMSRRLDRSRPLWEMYLVEGLEGGRFALLTKTHHSMVDGLSALDIGQVILDVTSEPRPVGAVAWRPTPGPTSAELVVGALAEWLLSPAALVEAVRGGLGDVRTTVGGAMQRGLGVLSAVRTAARPPAPSPLNVEIGQARRYGMAASSLADYKEIRRAHGGTINDVVLTVVSGALRAWLIARGESLTARSTIRAMVPVSVTPAGAAESGKTVVGNRVAAFLCDLPVGEPDPVVALQHITYEMAKHKESGQMMGAQAIVGVAGFAPPTLHSLGARAASGLSRRVYNLVVTNVPGPQFPLYAGGVRMLSTYPVEPLARGQALSIGLTSYDGGVYFGLNADRDAMPDIDVLARCLEEALADLLEATRGARVRSQ